MERAEFEQWKPKEVARLLALVETERRYYQEIVSNLPFGLVIVNAELNVVSSNRYFRSRSGLKNEEVLGKPLAQVFPVEAATALARQTIEQNQAQGRVAVEWCGQRATISSLALRGWEEDAVPEVLLVVEEQAAALPAALEGVLWQGDLSADFVAGRVALAAEGDQEQVRNFYEDLRGRNEAYLECAYRNQAGKACRDVVWLERSSGGEATAVVGMTLDDAAQEEALAQAATLAQADSLQRLSAKLSHDLNNLLMIISGYGEELKQALPADHSLHQDMQQILGAAERLYGLTHQFQAVSRRPMVNRKARLLRPWLEAFKPRLAETGLTVYVAEGVETETGASFDDGHVGDLLVAAARLGALAGAEGGTLSLSAGSGKVRLLLTLAGAEFPAGWLEPWFAGSEEQRDAQLALITAFHALRETGGQMHLGGAVLRLTLPAAVVKPEPAPAEAPVVEAAPVEAAPKMETILVVEDEAGIRALVRKILSRQGYEVIEAAGGTEALAALEEAAQVDLLLTDVMMPGMNGVELSRKALAAHPQLRVLFVSGYTDESVLEGGEFPAGTAFLQKPFTLGGLLGKVREVLDGGAARQAAS